jgi:hypothetical protein
MWDVPIFLYFAAADFLSGCPDYWFDCSPPRSRIPARVVRIPYTREYPRNFLELLILQVYFALSAGRDCRIPAHCGNMCRQTLQPDAQRALAEHNTLIS